VTQYPPPSVVARIAVVGSCLLVSLTESRGFTASPKALMAPLAKRIQNPPLSGEIPLLQPARYLLATCEVDT
jgi:hypothetical protein